MGKVDKTRLTRVEWLSPQKIIIERKRFTKMGFRTEGGFIGDREQTTGEPIPDHISARWQDIEQLIDGLISTYHLLDKEKSNPILTAAAIAFGFVFIHPFTDGNGRIHRYLIHYILAKLNLTDQGIIIPIPAYILDNIEDCRLVLESHSHPIRELVRKDDSQI